MLDILYLRFSEKMQKFLWFLFHIVGLCLGGIWLWCGIAAFKLELMFQAVSDAGIPTIVHHIMVVVGMVLLLFHVIEGLISKKARENSKKE